MRSRGLAIAGWTAALLAAGLHGVSLSRRMPLDGLQLGLLALAFALTALAFVGLVLALQREVLAGEALSVAIGDRLPRWGRWLLGLGFVYVALHLLDGVRGSGEGFSFDRTFTAVLAWQALATALFHTGVRGR
ncbi:MAG: hypothetical protein VKP62_09445 [Candidatus Sericytochromatia bacterium]|nr:hypothetical protein [Candidatus Sericytochromatia bacterium]